MKMHSVLTTLAASLPASLLGCSAASAQVGGMGPSPLGAATPLALGPGQPVAPTGIPLDATEMTSPGISPARHGRDGTDWLRANRQHRCRHIDAGAIDLASRTRRHSARIHRDHQPGTQSDAATCGTLRFAVGSSDSVFASRDNDDGSSACAVDAAMSGHRYLYQPIHAETGSIQCANGTTTAPGC